MPEASPLFWPRFSGQAVISLSVFYIPAAAIDPYQYRANAWLAVASRLSGVLFFGCVSMFSEDRQYWLFGVHDFAFLVPRAVLLTMMSRTDPSSGHRGGGRDSRTGFK